MHKKFSCMIDIFIILIVFKRTLSSLCLMNQKWKVKGGIPFIMFLLSQLYFQDERPQIYSHIQS